MLGRCDFFHIGSKHAEFCEKDCPLHPPKERDCHVRTLALHGMAGRASLVVFLRFPPESGH
jgi:hypothetical protein